MNNFMKLPNMLVWNCKNDNDTFLKEYGDKVLHILSYLKTNENRLGCSSFSIGNIIGTSGAKTKTGKGNINEQYREIIKHLVDKGIIVIKNSVDILKCNVNDFIMCELILECDNEFFMVQYEDYETILNADSTYNKLILLKIYYYILARMSRRANNINIEINGGKANCFYGSYEKIRRDLNVSENTLNKYLTYLKELHLIVYDNIGAVEKDNIKTTGNNVYALNEIELKYGLEESKLYYTEMGYKILNKKDLENIKRINGYLGKIKEVKNNNRNCKVEKLENKINSLTKKIHKEVI